MQSKLVKQVAPKYPKEAKKKHIEGVVRLNIVIDHDGKVIETNLRSGDPVLANAAVEAVREWRYKPTLLNGKPIEVQTEVDVNFHLH